jgi:alpha-1,6-mannosyltransferase
VVEALVARGRPLRVGIHAASAAELHVVLLGIASAALYLLVYLAERSLFSGRLAASVSAAPDAARVSLDLTLYYLATLGLFAAYARLLVMCSRGFLVGRSRTLALVFPVLFHLAWWLTQPFLSRDAFTYLAQGYLGVLPGGNPQAEPVTRVIATSLGADLARFGWTSFGEISPYGPLWTHIEIGVMRLSTDIGTAMLLIKGVVVLASLGSAALVWMILGRLRPTDQLLGTLAYLANPLIVVELAGEGHNDALMVFFVLASLVLSIARRPTTALLALLLGVLTKYLPLIFLPAELAYFWRSRGRSRLVRSLALAAVSGGLVAALAFAPLWQGIATFNGIGMAGQRSVQASTSGAFLWILERWLPASSAAQITSLVLIAIFVLILVATLRSVTDAQNLVRSCTLTALAYLLVASPYVWPWHAALPVALMCLSPRVAFLTMIFVLSLCCRLVAPLNELFLGGFISFRLSTAITTLVLIGIPLLLLAILSHPRGRAIFGSLGAGRGASAGAI